MDSFALTPLDFQVLTILFKNRVVKRSDIIEHISDFYPAEIDFRLHRMEGIGLVEKSSMAEVLYWSPTPKGDETIRLRLG